MVKKKGQAVLHLQICCCLTGGHTLEVCKLAAGAAGAKAQHAMTTEAAAAESWQTAPAQGVLMDEHHSACYQSASLHQKDTW